ncbi:MAG: phospholipase D-like domain-containing protein [Candidatus Zhuqueibacterota bacterium]
MKIQVSIFMSFLILSNVCYSQIIDIRELHQNNSQGQPLLLNQVVTISGEVTVSNQFGLVASVQDSSAGVMVYDAAFVSAVGIGDSVTISGKVTQYQGLTELQNITIQSHRMNSPTIEPQRVACRDIATEGAGGIENFEGELLRIDDVTVNTTAWGSNANYTLSDATGSCAIRIDDQCSLANTMAPSGTFDVIGVLSQYDTSSPYTSGYQLMPRFSSDILWHSGVKITSAVSVKNITPHSLTLCWETDSPANSAVIFGLSENYEIDTVTVSESVVVHEVEITGLTPATVYRVKVGSSIGSDFNFSSNTNVITASDPASTGKINVYFNQSVEHAYADSMQAAGNVNLLSKLIQRINAAKYSIDFCFYNVTQEEAAQVLIGAHQRGVKVRVITEDDNADEAPIQYLKAAGIPVIDDKFGNNSGSDYMHNKFMVIDHRDASSASDDWVWTGSYNVSYSATYDNAENVVEIQDQALAECYTIEFNEMWGSSSDTPNEANSVFGDNKTDNTPHYFSINGVEMTQVMSPSDGGSNYFVNHIQQAQSSLYFCIYSFTQTQIADAMREKWYQVPGFKVKGVFDARGSQYDNYSGAGSYPWNPPADVHIGNEAGIVHHKYLLIDANGGPGQPALITGSYNWSLAAENENDENFLIFTDETIANLYLQEFAARYHRAGGAELLTFSSVKDQAETTLPETISLAQNYPNPFNSLTRIHFTIPSSFNARETALKIFNINGQLVATLLHQKMSAGPHQVDWDGLDGWGKKVASGVYLYQLSFGDNYVSSKKLIVLE